MNKVQAPLVSVIIPVFNRRALLQQSVQSVLAQNYRPIEIILVDDGSDPEYKAFYQGLAQSIDEINLVAQANTGPGGARQLGLEHARGEFIQFLDSDDILWGNKLSAQVAELQANPGAHACYGPCVEYRSDQKLLNDADRTAIELLPPMRLTATLQAGLFPELLKARWWITSAPLYRRAVLAKIGPWSSLINEEDWEYEARIARLGGRLCFVPAVVSVRLLHDNHLSSCGAVSPKKLQSRALARVSIYKSAQAYTQAGFTPPISAEHWDFFARSVFLLARQCAAAGLDSEYKQLMEVAELAFGRKPLIQRVFSVVARLMGSKNAARLVSALGK